MNSTGKKSNVKEWLTASLNDEKSFVIYRLPFQDMARGMQVTHTVSLDLTVTELDELEGAFILSPFDRSKEMGWVLKGEGSCEELPFSENSDETEIIESSCLFEDDDVSREAYHEVFGSMMQALNMGVVDKVVLARRKRIGSVPVSLLPFLFEYLCKAHPGAFVYLIDHPQAGRWMGASPETLLKKREGVIETVALAATQKNTDLSANWGQKELEEQGLVSQFIDEVLKDFGVDCYEKIGPETVNAGEMVHLTTRYRINADALNTRLGSFLSELHPTPALCGFPKKPAFELITGEEGFFRQLYGGFLGPVTANGFQFFVNIRCMKLNEKDTFLYLGGGLTRSSVEEKEWEETRLKARTLLSVVQAMLNKFSDETAHIR